MDAQGSQVNTKTFYFFDGLRDGRNKMDPGLDNSFFDGINIYAVDGCLRTNDALFDPLYSRVQLMNLGATAVTNTTLNTTNRNIFTERILGAAHAILGGIEIPIAWSTGASGTSLFCSISDRVSNYYLSKIGMPSGYYVLSGSGASSFVFFGPISINPTDRVYFGVSNYPGSTPWSNSEYLNFYLDGPSNQGFSPVWNGIRSATSIGGSDQSLSTAKGLYFYASNYQVPISSCLKYSGSGNSSLSGLLIANSGNVSFIKIEDGDSGLIEERVSKYKSYGGSLYRDIYLSSVNMNDRSAVVAGGPSSPPRWVYASGGGFGSSSMITYFKNGTTSDASGYQLATVWPLVTGEFKNRLHLDNVAIQYSDSSGLHTEWYPHSSFPSDGFVPNVFDWNNEMLFDTTRQITNAIEYRDYYFRFTDSDVYYTSYDSNGDQTAPQKLISAPGTSHADSAAVLGGLLYWANEDGVYVTDGSGFQTISSGINNVYVRELFKHIADASNVRNIRVFASEKTNELFVSVTFRNELPDESYVVNGFTLVYNATLKSWGVWEIPLVGVVNRLTGIDAFVTAVGGILVRRKNGVSTYALGYTNVDYDLYRTYNATGHSRVEKACLLSPDYSKQADTVYARVMMKGCSCASQAFKITTFWDGQPSSPNAKALTFNVTPTQTGYDDVVTTNKFLLPGKGNLAYFKLERNPTDHGTQPLEFIGIQIQYSLVDRSDE